MPALHDILARGPAGSVDEVVALMTAIDTTLQDTDGLKWFNRLYLRVTVAVRAAIGDGSSFRDPRFLEQLDLEFANLYFDAAAAGDRDAAAAPAAWRPLFRERHRPGLLRIQHALAGMNAHINRDLPDGIVRAYTALGGAPGLTDPRHQDFERVNGILATVEDEVKGEFATGIVGRIDTAAGSADDALAMWSVRVAREAAWTHAEVLWHLRSVPRLRATFFDQLDRFTGFAGRGLLVPAVVAPLG